MRIATWNSLGKPIGAGNPKENVLQELLAACEFVLIQEAGVLASMGSPTPSTASLTNGFTFHVFGVRMAGAANNRCDTAIVSQIDYPFESWNYLTLPSSSGRSGLYVESSGWVIATLHSDAGGSSGIDMFGFLSHLGSTFGDNKPVVIGGDFNQSPERKFETGSGTRTRWSTHSTVAHTHSSGGTFDYFMTNSAVLKNDGPRVLNLHGDTSDHKPVYISVIKMADA